MNNHRKYNLHTLRNESRLTNALGYNSANHLYLVVHGCNVKIDNIYTISGEALRVSCFITKPGIGKYEAILTYKI